MGEVLSLPRLSLIAAHNLYEDANGESHFRDIEVEWAQESPSGRISKRMPAAGLMVREITANFADTWQGKGSAVVGDGLITWRGNHHQFLFLSRRPGRTEVLGEYSARSSYDLGSVVICLPRSHATDIGLLFFGKASRCN